MLTILPDTISPPPAEQLREAVQTLRGLRALMQRAAQEAEDYEQLLWRFTSGSLLWVICDVKDALRARDARLKETP